MLICICNGRNEVIGTFLIFFHPVGLHCSRIVSEAGVVVCIPEFICIQGMHTTSPIFRASITLRVHRMAYGAPFSGALLGICHLTILTYHFVCNY